jgi:hypothetical protein
MIDQQTILPAEGWSAKLPPALGVLYEAELIDAMRQVYRFPSGVLLAVFEGRPGTPGEDHPLVGLVPVRQEFPTHAHDGLVELERVPAFPITVLVARQA